MSDHLSKAALHLLAKHRVSEGDAIVVSLSSNWDENIAAGRLRVENQARAGTEAAGDGWQQNGPTLGEAGP